jgi:uncharacterized glyoxalase superfamily protein PhnB
MQETMKSTQTFYPAMRFADAAKAMTWLSDAFGFEEAACYRDDGGVIVHAEMRFKNGLIMFGNERNNDYPVHAPRPGGELTGSVYVAVPREEIDAHYERAKSAGARIVRELCETEYGSREYSAYDFEGHVWSFGTYQP